MKIVWTEPARQDLRDTFEYIAEDSAKAARSLLAEIKERVCVLVNQPQLRRCKIFRIVKDVYRGKHKNYSLTWNLVAALVNLRHDGI